MAGRTGSLSEFESNVLAIVVRDGPTTAYKVRKVLEEMPSAGVSGSSGSVYPIVARLKEGGLISAVALPTDGRNTEFLYATKQGRSVIRKWVVQITPEQLLPADALLARVSHAELLSPAERLAWLTKVRAALRAQLDELEGGAQPPGPGRTDHARSHAIAMTRARIAWIDGILETGRK